MARKNQIFHVSYIEYFQFLVKKKKILGWMSNGGSTMLTSKLVKALEWQYVYPKRLRTFWIIQLLYLGFPYADHADYTMQVA